MKQFEVKAIQFTGDAESANRIRVMLGRQPVFAHGETHLSIDNLRFEPSDYAVLYPDGCIAKVKSDAFAGRYTRKYPKVTSPSPENTIYIRKNEIL